MKVLRGRRVHEARMRHLSTAGKCGLLGYAREVHIDIGQSLVPEALEVYLPHFRSLVQVQTLKISHFDPSKFLPTFERFFAQFVPTLRSLHLPHVVGGVHEVLELICKFPHLDDLSLTLSSPHCANVPPEWPVAHSPPLKGTLVLRGWMSAPVRFLLEIPGGLHFRSIDVGGVDKAELDEILAACSSTLEVFSLCPRSCKSTWYYHPPGNRCGVTKAYSFHSLVLDATDLSQNFALTRFELRVDPDDLMLVPPLLHETLSTISSPVFSEFTLKLEDYLVEDHFFYLLSREALWGDEWGIVDRDLNDMVQVAGKDIRFVVQVGAHGGVWLRELRGFMGVMFPLMSARGLVGVVKSTFQAEDERFIW